MKSISKWLGFKKYFYFAVKNKSKEKQTPNMSRTNEAKTGKRHLRKKRS